MPECAAPAGFQPDAKVRLGMRGPFLDHRHRHQFARRRVEHLDLHEEWRLCEDGLHNMTAGPDLFQTPTGGEAVKQDERNPGVGGPDQ